MVFCLLNAKEKHELNGKLRIFFVVNIITFRIEYNLFKI